MTMHRGKSAASIDRLRVSLDDLPTVTLGGTEDPAPLAKNGKPKTSRLTALVGLDRSACRRVLEYVSRHLSGVEEG